MEEQTMILERIKFWAPMWGGWFPIQAAGVYTIFAAAPDYWWVYTMLGYVLLMMLGLSACYHRLLSHRSFQTGRVRKCFMIWCAIMSGQGSPIYWVLIHRGYHHRLADTDRDPHSPRQGFWHSYFLWMFKMKQDSLSPKYAVDLMRDADVVFAHKHYLAIFWVSHIVIYLISPVAWLWGVMLPAFIAFHSYAINTSVNHWTKFGYKNYETKDDGVNVVWLWPFILGEAWHNNHHGRAGNSNFGKLWWELDPTHWLIWLIRSDR
jgi:stearoyl-CoA desaturase (delta-9 desaturase)